MTPRLNRCEFPGSTPLSVLGRLSSGCSCDDLDPVISISAIDELDSNLRVLPSKHPSLPDLSVGGSTIGRNQNYVCFVRKQKEVWRKAINKVTFLVPFHGEGARLVLARRFGKADRAVDAISLQ